MSGLVKKDFHFIDQIEVKITEICCPQFRRVLVNNQIKIVEPGFLEILIKNKKRAAKVFPVPITKWLSVLEIQKTCQFQECLPFVLEKFGNSYGVIGAALLIQEAPNFLDPGHRLLFFDEPKRLPLDPFSEDLDSRIIILEKESSENKLVHFLLALYQGSYLSPGDWIPVFTDQPI